ncbi:hypothetical protein PQX77_009691 [Marasmius sp. AFHP31]|nr:hypothetical protein PQX77_009691 [Marasmius sp. AFHP31]
MQPIKFLGRLTIILLLISCVCSVLAETKDIHARKVKVGGARPKAKPKVAAPKVKAKSKTRAIAKAKPKRKPKLKPKTKVPTKAKPKAKAPAKATPKGKTSAKKSAPKNAAKSCPLPKKGNRLRAFETNEELDAYYGIVKRDFSTPEVRIRGRLIEKRTDACGFNELRDQPEAKRGCRANTDRFVIDVATGNLVKQGQGPDPSSTRKVACDHIIELQLVANVMDKTGVCAAAQRMLAAGGFQAGLAPSIAKKMQELFDEHIVPTVNGASNVIFLDSGVNQSKKTYVQKFMNQPTASLPGGTATNTGNHAAHIRTYLTDSTIRTKSLESAEDIDDQIAAFLQAAKQEALQELQKKKDKAGARCTETQQTRLATAESVISAEPARSKDTNYPDIQALWAEISNL